MKIAFAGAGPIANGAAATGGRFATGGGGGMRSAPQSSRYSYESLVYGFLFLRGNVRGGRGRGAGRGAGRGGKQDVTAADLDKELDAYVSKV